MSRLLAASAFISVLIVSVPLYAQEVNLISATIARTFAVVEDEAEPGDIISFDETEGVYRLARQGDQVPVGIIVSNPLLILETDPNGLPVVQDGEAAVNVSTLNGTIEIGDPIASSAIPGKGERARANVLAIGTARESFFMSTTTITVEGQDVALGTIRVQLSGVLKNAEESAGQGSFEAPPGGPIPQAFKFLMALLIGVGSVYLSFRSFGANIKNGIISIGRNPLAKNTIQAMVVLNIILIIIVAGGGLLLSIAILLLPF